MTRPPRLALLTSHGQPSAPPPPELQLATLAARVADHLPGWEVRSATLASRGFLEQAMQDGAVVYPFFMARGYFTAKVLPNRLRGFHYRMACPFGLDPELPRLTAGFLSRHIRDQNWQEDETRLLLAAHGSARGPKAAEAAEAFIAKLQSHLPQVRITPGYVEQAPRLAEAARDLTTKALCLPFFAQSGEHVRDDIPEALEAAGFAGTLLPVLGAVEHAERLIARAIVDAEDTEVLGGTSPE